MKRKLSIPTDRAAYAASQPLFDSLRDVHATTGDVLSTIEELRDKAQRLHVEHDKGETIENAREFLSLWLYLHNTYKQTLNQIHRATTKMFEDRAIVGASREDVEKTLLAMIQGHDTFRGCIEDVRTLLKQAMSDTQGDAVAAAPNDNRIGKRRKINSHVKDNKRASSTTEGVDPSSSRKPDSSIGTAAEQPHTAQQKTLQYANNTADIEARLRAREERLLAAREKKSQKEKERKRKRESAGSLDSVQGRTQSLHLNGGGGGPMVGHVIGGAVVGGGLGVVKPARKKSRTDGDGRDGAERAARHDRRQDLGRGGGEPNGAGRKRPVHEDVRDDRANGGKSVKKKKVTM